MPANPKDTKPLRLDEEVREIEEGLKRSVQREQFQIISKWAVQADDLRRSLLDYEPHIVHFSGHGTGGSGIALENSSGQTKLVTANALKRLFSLFREQIECVLLNACYSDIQASAIHNCIDTVIGMNQDIGDKAAIKFSIGFYDALGAGRKYQDAYEFGCSAIYLDGTPENLTPVLHHKQDNTRNSSSTTLTEVISPSQKTTQKDDKSDSIAVKVRKKAKFSIVLEADKNEENLAKILAVLKDLSGDSTLKIREVEEGSIKLTIEGSEDGFLQLETLFRSGELTQRLEIIVKSLDRLPEQVQDSTLSADDPLKVLEQNNLSFYKGAVVKGKVERHTDKGVYVNIGSQIAAFLPKSEISLNSGVPLEKSLPINSEREFLIIQVQDADNQVILSIDQLAKSRLDHQYQPLTDNEVEIESTVEGTSIN